MAPARRTSPWPTARAVVRAIALLVGLLAFLRAPFATDPDPRLVPTSGEPAPSPEERNSPITWAAFVQPLVPAPNRAHADARELAAYVGSSDVNLHTVASGGPSLAERIDARLDVLEDFGDLSAARDVLLLLGADHQSRGDFANAAEYYESAQQADGSAPCPGPACDTSAASLENAFLFRRAAGDTERALADAAAFDRHFAHTHPRATTRVLLAASELTPAERQRAQLRRLTRRRLPPAERIQVLVRLARHERGVRRRQAYQEAVRVWEQSGGELMATSPGLGPTEWVAELGRAREAVAEAQFARAERRFRAARALRSPRYAGPATETAARRWVERELRPWFAERTARMRSARQALDAVDALGLTQQSVAAAARRGDLQHDLARELRELDTPDAVMSEGAEQGEFLLVRQERELLHDKLVAPAIGHWRQCMQAASDARAYGEWSERCADALSTYDPRYERPQELHPALRERK